MNYFKLRTLIIILILLMVSFLFTYIYTNGNYVRVSTDLEMRKQMFVPMKAVSQHSHLTTDVNSSDSKQDFLNINQEHNLRNIPNENDIPVRNDNNDVVINVKTQQQLLTQQKQHINSKEEQQETKQQQNIEQQDTQQQQDTGVALKQGNIPSATKTQLLAVKPCNSLRVKGKSKWFDQRFNGAISPVWSRDNIRQSSDVSNWWLKLQSSKNPNVVGVMETAFHLIPDVDVYKDRSQCRRCAVVGNSGNLKGSKYGAEIDAHSMVIRMNEAPLSGFEEDVGYRETHRLMYPESFYHIKPDVHFVLVSFKTLDVEWLISAMTTGSIKRTWKPVKNLINVNASLVQIYNPALMKQVHEVWNNKQGRYPSTGLLAIMFALHACDEVDVYGYGANKIGNWDHYWQNDGGKVNSAFRKTGVHNSNSETQVYQQLNAEGIITLHMGNAHR